MGFFSWIRNVGEKLGGAVSNFGSKLLDGARWVGDKAGQAVSAVRSGVDFARNLPVVGAAVDALLATPPGQALQSGINVADRLVGDVNRTLQDPMQIIRSRMNNG
jgi:hypothetical protein